MGKTKFGDPHIAIKQNEEIHLLKNTDLDGYNWIESKWYTTPVIPNRGAALHYGAVKWCQGCRQLFQFLNFYTY